MTEEDKRWCALYSRGMEPDHNGWDTFEVYARDNQFYWSATDDDGAPVGFEHGPFPTAQEAYHNAL